MYPQGTSGTISYACLAFACYIWRQHCVCKLSHACSSLLINVSRLKIPLSVVLLATASDLNLHVLGSNVSLILRDLNGSVHDMVRRPSLLLNFKNILIHSQFPDPSVRSAAFIIDILDNDVPCLLTDMEQYDILYYLCCD